MEKTELISKINEFETSEAYEKCLRVLSLRDDFLNRFPFRQQPGLIDELTQDNLYNPHSGDTDYFFNWIEHKLQWLGAVSLGSAKPWENARKNIDNFKDLLKIATDDKISIANKIDAHWEDIKGFGGDRHAVKKIISIYYPEKIIPIFKTEDWELLFDLLGMDYTERIIDKFRKNYCGASVGEKFETLNELLLEFKESQPEFEKMDNALFMNFLYVVFREEVAKTRNREYLD